jgi:hypothetical protein
MPKRFSKEGIWLVIGRISALLASQAYAKGNPFWPIHIPSPTGTPPRAFALGIRPDQTNPKMFSDHK